MSAPKKGSNRVKGNLKPSSSSQAALLLGQTPGFIGFGGQSAPSFVPLSSMLEDVDSSLDADIRLVLRKLSKKDTTTKIKALQELSELCQQKDTEILKSMLPFWPRLYNRLSMDLDCKVREAVHNTFLVVSVRVGKEIAPYLKSIMGCWIVSQCDTYPTVAFSAIKVFQNTFPGNKQNDALTMYRQEILDHLVENLVNHTPQSLSDPKTTDQVEMDSKYSRVIASSLAGCRKLFTSVTEGKLPTLEPSLTKLFENGKFWKHSKSTVPGIKAGFYSFIAVVCQSFQDLATKYASKITPIVLHNLDISNPVIVAPMWEAILSLVNHVPDSWNHVSWQKGFWSKLRKNLENGFDGNAASVSLNLMPLLSKVPESVVEDKDFFYIEFLASFRAGFNQDSVLNSSSDCAALIKSFVECCRYLIVQAVNREDQELGEKILDQFLMEIVKAAILDEKPSLSSSPLFFCVASLLESFEKSVKMSKLAELFWKHFEDFACQVLEDEQESKKILRLLKLVKGFVTKNTLSRKSVKFINGDMKELTSTKSTKSVNSVEIESPNMMNFYTKVLCEIFQKIHVKEEVDIFFDLFTEIFLLFSNKRIISSILGQDQTGDKNIYMCFFDSFILPHLNQHRKNLNRSSCLMSMSFKCINDNQKDVELASGLLNKLIENCPSLIQSCLMFENMIAMQKEDKLQPLELKEEAVYEQIVELVKETSLLSSNSSEPANVKLVDKGWTIISSVLAVCEEGSVFNSQCAEKILFTIGQELVVHMRNAKKQTTLNQAIQFVSKAACSFFDNLKDIVCRKATEELMISLFAIKFDVNIKLDKSVMDSCEEAWTKGLKVLLKFNRNEVYTGPFVDTACEVLRQTTLSKDTTSELFERVSKNLEILFELLFADLDEDDLAEDVFELLLQKLFIDKRYTPELKYLLSLIYVHQNVVSITHGFTNHSSKTLPNLLVVIHQTMFNLKLMKQMFTVNSSSALRKQGSDALESFKKKCLLSVFRGLALAKKIMNFEPSKDEQMLLKHLDELKSNVNYIIDQMSEQDVRDILQEAKKSALKNGEFDAVYLNCMYEQVPKFFDFEEAELLKDVGLPSSGTFHTLQVLLPLFSVEGVRALLVAQVTNFLRSLQTTDPWQPSKSLSLSLSCLRILQDLPEEKAYREKLCRDLLQQILKWRESDEKLFITADDDTSDLIKIVNNIEIMKFISFVVVNCVDLLSDKDWDFILCSLVAWIEKVISYDSYDNLEVHAVLFAVTVCNLLTKVSHCMLEASKCQPMYFPPNLLTEWNEFFSEGLYGELLPRYVTLAADQSVSDDVFKKTVVDSMGGALSRCSKDQILKHKLSTYLSAEDDTTVSQNIQTLLNHVCPLLTSSRSNIQTTAFNMVEKLMNEDALFSEKPEEDSTSFAEEACVKSPPKAIIDVIKKCGDALDILLTGHCIGDYVSVDENTEEYQFTFGYLVSWKLVLYLFKTANPQFRAMYASYLKESNLFSKFLVHLFILLPPDRAASAGDFKIPSDHCMENGTHDIHQIAFELYYQCLETTPALVRQWWTDLDRKTSSYVEKFTSKLMSPMLCSDEISSVQPSSDDLEGITIKPRPSTREVVATYVMAEVKIVVTITLPENFPLGVIAVSSDKRVGATQAQWDRWLLQLNIFLQHQNGTIIEGLKLWKKNIDKRFDGVEDCMICFSVLHGTTFQLPKLQCRTCKKKYHSACLYKWFSTSMNSTCPLCRNLF